MYYTVKDLIEKLLKEDPKKVVLIYVPPCETTFVVEKVAAPTELVVNSSGDPELAKDAVIIYV